MRIEAATTYAIEAVERERWVGADHVMNAAAAQARAASQAVLQAVVDGHLRLRRVLGGEPIESVHGRPPMPQIR